MADILKITTPLNNKNQINQLKQVVDPNTNFDISDVSKVIKTSNESGMQGHNNGLIDKDTSSSLLTNLLKDPTVTISYLKNIFLLQEVVKLLPVNNTAFTEEMQLLFNNLLISPENIVNEIVKQENNSSVFKGELFDFLRNLSKTSSSVEKKLAIANFLKSLNGHISKKDIIESLINNLKFLQDEYSSSNILCEEIKNTIENLQKNSTENFNNTKKSLLSLFEKLENSILFNEKNNKIISISRYNLSRFIDNKSYLRESIDNLLKHIDSEADKDFFVKLVGDFILEFEQNSKNIEEKSSVMKSLSRIIEKQALDSNISQINSEKIEKIINSLLSSPCNFTPLLHFIIPVEYMDIKSFAEIWIESSFEQENKDENDKNKNIHMFITFEVEQIGRFEAELFVIDNNIDLILACPEQYLEAFSSIDKNIKESLKESMYNFREIKIEKFEKTKSLMEVFKDLPKKRTGLDVTI